MHSLRKWFYRPKKEDSSKLALFYWADEELTMVAAELDSFDGRTDPDRCSILVSQLRICQDKVLSICNDIMDDAIPDLRANRDFRAKFPDDVLHENLAGQLWFGAECLAAGSNIIHRELESASMRPLAKALTRALDNVRCLLREQSLKNSLIYSEKVREALRIFDRLFSEFELCYVSAMVPIKSAKEYHLQQEIVVLFSETMIRALKIGLISQDMVDDYDPSLMFTIPRLAIVWGLLLYPDGPFNVEKESAELSELFRPFCNLLFKIRDLLWTLTEPELHTLEKMLCSLEEPKMDEKSNATEEVSLKATEDLVPQFQHNHLNCKQFIHDFYAFNFGIHIPENGVPESSEDTLMQEKHPVDVRKSDKSENNNMEFEVEFQHENSAHKSPEVPESDIETLVSSDFGVSDYDDIVCNVQNMASHLLSACNDFIANHSQNKKSEDSVSDECLRTTQSSLNNPHPNNMLSSHQNPPTVIEEKCAICDPDINLLEHTTSSLENRLNRLHEDCTCGLDSSSREHLTPSREIMRQIMRRVEIVPPGQRIASYSSSIENSPRAYHHGLLSHSFPTHPAHASHGCRSDMSGRRKMKRMSQRRSKRNSSVPCDSELSSPRHDNSNYQNNTQSSDSRTPNRTWGSHGMIPRVIHLQEEDDATNSEAIVKQRRKSRHNSSIPCDSELSSPRHDNSNYQNNTQSSDSRTPNLTWGSHGMIPRVIRLQEDDDASNSELSSPRHDNSNYQNNTQSSDTRTPNLTWESHGMIPRVIRLQEEDDATNSEATVKQRHRSMHNSSVPCDSEVPLPRHCNSNYQNNTRSSDSWTSPLLIPRVQRLREEDDATNSEATYSSCSSCQSISSVSSPEWDSTSPDTSSYNSLCQDDEEIALALQAAEIASRNKARSRFKSSRDLLHKLFVCVSGVADQLQTNYASDLRNILKSVFDMNCAQSREEPCDNTPPGDFGSNNHEHSLLGDTAFSNMTENILSNNVPSSVLNNNDDERDRSSVDSAEEVIPDNSPTPSLVIPDLGQDNENDVEILTGPPEWMPDELSSNCMACKVQFTILRRRHHCRNCGKIFCSRCSSNSIPLPRFGHLKPVRVCNQCFMYQLTNLVMQRQLFR